METSVLSRRPRGPYHQRCRLALAFGTPRKSRTVPLCALMIIIIDLRLWDYDGSVGSACVTRLNSGHRIRLRVGVTSH